MKKIFITSVIFVLLIAASVFAYNQKGASNENSCPLKQSAETSTTGFENSKVVVAQSDENCCHPGAECCKGGACCKSKHKSN